MTIRDHSCIGCGAPVEACIAHHDRPWAHGGPTDIPNMASLCRTCHKLVHDHHWQIHTDHTGRPRLRPPPTPQPAPT